MTRFDSLLRRLRNLSDIFWAAKGARHSTDAALAEALLSADMVIGAVLIPGASAPQLVSTAQLKQLKPGAVPLNSSKALNKATSLFVPALAENGMAALETDPHLAAGLNVHQGKLVHPAVIEALHHL